MIDLTVLLQYSGYLALMAFFVEYATEIIKANVPERFAKTMNDDVKKAIALVVSFVIFIFVSPLQPFQNPAANTMVNIFALLLVSRGSNFVHDFFKLLRQKVEENSGF